MAKENKSYEEKLKHPKWQRKRLEIMQRDDFKCKKCGDEETCLQVHHLKYESGLNPWESDSKDLITLCEHCHQDIESFKNENPEMEFDKVEIYKSSNWKGRDRIMFLSYNGTCTMRIYSKDNNFKCGYNLCDDISDIIKILRHTIKNK
jgi:5-methylcytosine-specific restriction endonuclease McrA